MGGRGADIARLDRRQRQVLVFVAAYADEHGCLPTASEVAIGCGIGSNATVLRALRDLERLGLIVRDPAYPRLGHVTTDLPACGVGAERFLVDVAIVESMGNLDILRAALAWAPEPEAIAFLHREGASRALLLRAYTEAQRRLAGVELPRVSHAYLEELPARIRDRHALVDDWPTYCLYSSVITIVSRRALSQLDGAGLRYIEPVFITETVVYDLEARLDRLVAAEHAQRRPHQCARLVAMLVDRFNAALRGMNAALCEVTMPTVELDEVERELLRPTASATAGYPAARARRRTPSRCA